MDGHDLVLVMINRMEKSNDRVLEEYLHFEHQHPRDCDTEMLVGQNLHTKNDELMNMEDRTEL